MMEVSIVGLDGSGTANNTTTRRKKARRRRRTILFTIIVFSSFAFLLLKLAIHPSGFNKSVIILQRWGNDCPL
jgi:hypothetical protein